MYLTKLAILCVLVKKLKGKKEKVKQNATLERWKDRKKGRKTNKING